MTTPTEARKAAALPINRFTRAPAWVARIALAGVIAVIICGALLPPAPVPPTLTAANANTGDAAFYRVVTARVRRGDDYYVASAQELRRRGGALYPFVTIRPPFLTALIADVGGESSAGLVLLALAVAATVAVALRFRDLPLSRVGVLSLTLLAAASITTVATAALFHEAWAGLLIVLSLACWTAERWWISACIALTAVLLRELAAPFLLAMLFFAGREGRRRESAGYVAALLIFATVLALHARDVDAVRLASDTHARAWTVGGGWPFVLRLVHDNSLLINFPLWTAAIAVPLSIFGWSSWQHPVAERGALYITGMLAAFTFVGRPENVYWGLMVAALVPIGLGFAPAGLYAAAIAARRKR